MLRGSSDIIPRSCSLPMAEEVMSDSALDRQRCGLVHSLVTELPPPPSLRCDSLRSETSISTLSALSDTEVEVKDRLTSKLWEWSATSRRKRGTSLVSMCVEGDRGCVRVLLGYFNACLSCMWYVLTILRVRQVQAHLLAF